MECTGECTFPFAPARLFTGALTKIQPPSVSFSQLPAAAQTPPISSCPAMYQFPLLSFNHISNPPFPNSTSREKKPAASAQSTPAKLRLARLIRLAGTLQKSIFYPPFPFSGYLYQKFRKESTPVYLYCITKLKMSDNFIPALPSCSGSPGAAAQGQLPAGFPAA